MNVELNQYFTSAFVFYAEFDLSWGYCRIQFISMIQFDPTGFDLDYILENQSGHKSNPELNKNIELNQYFNSTGDKFNPELNENAELNQYFTYTRDKSDLELNKNVGLN